MKKVIACIAFIPCLFLLYACPVKTVEGEGTGPAPRYQWVSTDADVINLSGPDILITPKQKYTWITLNEALSYPYEFSFTESRTNGQGDITLLWNYYLMGASFPKGLSTGFNQKLVIRDDGSSEFWESVYLQENIGTATPGPRNWRIVCDETNVSIYLNDTLIKSDALTNTSNFIASVAFQVNGRNSVPGTFSIQDFQVVDSGSNRSKPVIQQFPIPGRNGQGVLTVFSSQALGSTMDSFLAEMPDILHRIEQEAGTEIDHADIVIAIYEQIVGAGSNLGVFPYYGGWLVVPPHIEGNYFAMAHEMAHYFRAAGGIGGSYNVGDNWFLEGFASYLGQRALNLYQGKPLWYFDVDQGRMKTNFAVRGAWDPPMNLGVNITNTVFVPAGETPGNVAKESAYGKGYMYFFLIDQILGHHHIQNIIAKNLTFYVSSGGYTPQLLTDDLRVETANAVDPLIPGWLTDTNYVSWTPLHFLDDDGDQVIGLIEALHGTDPHLMDSDGDTVSDYDELVNGTDPTNNLSY